MACVSKTLGLRIILSIRELNPKCRPNVLRFVWAKLFNLILTTCNGLFEVFEQFSIEVIKWNPIVIKESSSSTGIIKARYLEVKEQFMRFKKSYFTH